MSHPKIDGGRAARLAGGLIAALALLAASATATAGVTVRVTIENLAPGQGTFLTPFWVGFHNGGFDLYNSGQAASTELERLAEDGDTAPLSGLFASMTTGGIDGTLFGPGGVIAPGEMAMGDFMLADGMSNSYFSYASMIIPSNDAFVANGDPMAFNLFDGMGNFVGADFIILGSMVLDAGTEVNDEIPMNTAFLGQMAPNVGVDENGVVHTHPGFIPGGNILSDSRFSNANFLAANYRIARVRVTAVPEPSTLASIGLGAGLILLARRRSRRRGK
jgi:hypothetical protein